MTAIPQTVKASNLRPEFYKREEDGATMIRVANLADKGVYVAKAQPEHIKQWPEAYAAFENGGQEIDVGGTQLTEVPGITSSAAKGYKLKGVRNAEELAALSDAACSALGHGVLTARKSAQLLLRAKAAEAQLDAAQQKRGPGRPPKEADAA